MKSKLTRALWLALALSLVTAGASAGPKNHLTTAEECADGEHNGAALGDIIGSMSLCISAGGQTILYAGGDLPYLCGTIIVAGQPVPGAQSDPNECDTLYKSDLHFSVMLPSDYETSEARYPVLYLLAGSGMNENSYAARDPQVQQVADSGVIVVFPDARSTWYSDWELDDDARFESLYIEELIPLIDSTFRTNGDRAHRAVGGVSMGGYGAMMWAARHPDLFVAAASFSGVTDIRHRGVMWPQTFVLDGTYDNPTANTPVSNKVWGSSIENELGWRNKNPVDLASNLRGVDVFLSAGDGVPTMDDAMEAGPGLGIVSQTEREVGAMTETLSSGLTALQIDHVYTPHGGTHSWAYWTRDLATWFPTLQTTFGTPAPATFDYTSADPEFSVYGWDVRADERREGEFLRLEDASADGVTLVGSGMTSVTTSEYFKPNKPVCVVFEDSAQTLRADHYGRLSFDVDLGPAHSLKQYTPEQQLVEDAGYFVTRSVSFDPPTCQAAGRA